MSLLVIQHSARDRVGLIGELPFEIKVHRADLDPEIPRLGDAAGLIVMGGPQAAYTDAGFPSRQGELRVIQEAMAAGVPMLGICLGAQLLAVANGARGYRREIPEIGWLPVELTTEGRQDPLMKGVARTFTPRQKHFDSFELPEGATRLASSEECVEQGFRIGECAWGIQFHIEMKRNQAQDLVALEGDEVPAPDPIDPNLQARLEALEPTAMRIFNNFASEVVARSEEQVSA